MKSPAIPWTCGLALAAMMGAAISHWCSVNQLMGVMAMNNIRPQELRGTPAPGQNPAVAALEEEFRKDSQSKEFRTFNSKPTHPNAQPDLIANNPTTSKGSTPPVANDQREFFSMLVEQMKSLKQENQELRDQMAESNRDNVSRDFRLDTLSKDFRPLKITNDVETTFENNNDSPGVLPPRAIVPDDLPR